MIELLVLKEKLKAFYGKYNMFVVAAVKFLLGFVTFYLLNHNIGFMGKLRNPLIPLVLALVSAFVPYGAVTCIAAAFMLLHLSSVSFEMALLMLIVFMIVGILYYGFHPGDSYLLLLTPILFFLKIPYAVPLLVGLSGSVVSAIPVGCGVFIYYAIQYVKQNAGILTNDASVDITQKYTQVIKAVFGNQLMLVMTAAFIVSILVVYIFRTMSMDYAWFIAIIAGTVTQLVVIFIGDFTFNVSVSMIELLIGAVLSVVVAFIFMFFAFAVDYSRTEYLQFEDDDYHYFVKAVPKIVVTAPDVKVQKINARRGQRSMRDS